MIAFAHLTVGTPLLSRLAREEFDRDPRELVLLDKVGLADPLLSTLMVTLCHEASAPGMRRIYRDSLLTVLCLSVLKRHATLLDRQGPQSSGLYKHQGGLTGWQLRRVTDFLAENALRNLALDEVVQITGLSRAQFFRAFQRSTGDTPARYVQRLRMRHAASLLEKGHTITDVATRIGYVSGSHFATVFRHYNGVNPAEWQRLRRSGFADQARGRKD